MKLPVKITARYLGVNWPAGATVARWGSEGGFASKTQQEGRTIGILRGLEASMSRGPSIEAEKVQNSGSRSARGMMVLADLGSLVLKKRVVNWQKQFQNSVLDSDNCSKTAC